MNRRGFLIGLVSAPLAAPAIIPIANLMPVRGIIMPVEPVFDLYPNDKLEQFRREINRAFIRANLFNPYMDWPHYR